MTDKPQQSRVCRVCGGHLLVFLRLPWTDWRPPLAYYKCERCAHVVIVEE